MTRIVLTYEDYAALPDDGKRYELHEGELSVTPAPGERHQDILLNLTLLLSAHVRAARRGKLMLSPFDCILSETTVVEPDLVYVDESRRPRVSPRGVEGSPTLAVEIISPYSKQIDRRRKMALYAAHDVTWYWVVDPDARTVEAYRLDGDAYRLEAMLDGPEPRALPPFSDLVLDPLRVWDSGVPSWRPLTYDDYAAMPNDGKRYELHEGELSVIPTPTTLHQETLGNLLVILAPHVRATGRGEIMLSPFDCIMSNITVVQPDLIYLDEVRASLLSERALEGAPTLAIEIVIPSTLRVDRTIKMALYANHDVPWYWIVDPDGRAIEVYHLQAGVYRLEATLAGAEPRALPPLSDLRLDPASIWPERRRTL
jgi:Uma2 family endonuclease